MSNPADADATPITSVRQMADYLAAGCKPPDQFRIGTEHEKFGFRVDGLSPPPYEPADGHPASIRAVLEGLVRLGGTPILDGRNIIGLQQNGASVSLEPAGQLELSGAPLKTLHETKQELEAHFEQVRAASEGLDMGFAPLGFHPLARRDAMPWMPKGRYAIMRRYMPLVGSLGLDMMTRTCTVQVNLDYASEQDMRRKLRVSLLLQPLATALFANSPFTEGRPNGFLSYRAQVWTDTDNRRAGIPEVMFEDGFGFERYATWLIEQVPMYFVLSRRRLHRCGRPVVCRLYRRTAAVPGRRQGLDRRLLRPPDNGLYRRTSEAISGNARRGRRPARHDGGAIGTMGGIALRRCGADGGGGIAARCRLGGRGCRPRRGSATGPGGSMAGWNAARHRVRRGRHRQGRAAVARVPGRGEPGRAVFACATGSDRRRRANPGGILARALPWRLAGGRQKIFREAAI